MPVASSSFATRLRRLVLLPALLAALLPLTAAARELSIATAGAVGDGTTLNTAAIQKAIDGLSAGGGGTLVIPQGKFVSGAIFLKPGVNLRLDPGAVLKGSTNIADYPESETRIEGHFEVWIPALVNANHVDHLRITGQGMIAGGGQPFWDAYWQAVRTNRNTTNLAVKRPRNIFIQDSKDVQITGLTLRESALWNLHLFRCSQVVVEKLDIRTPPRSPSTDGIDVDSCQDVAIRDCYISVDDDDISLKGNKGTSALTDQPSPPVENIRVSGCTFGLGAAALTVGSEATVVRDVTLENCRLVGTNKNCILRLKLRADTEEHYENISARNIVADNPSAQLISIQPWNQFFDLQGKPAPDQWVTNVTLLNITGTLHDFGKVAVREKSSVAGLTFKNINLTLNNPAVLVRDVKNAKFDRVLINGVPYTGDQEAAGK